VVVAYTLVDDDQAHLAQYRWTLDKDGYVIAGPHRGVKLRMHRVVLGLEKGDGLEGDHINGDRLDNRRANLRAATRQQNGQNVPAKHGVRGVTFDPDRDSPCKWRVRIGLAGRAWHVGWFATEAEAAQAADAWYAEHMPFANLERHRAPA
jgi:hypothetical protein